MPVHVIWDKKYSFYTSFNPEDGFYIRGNTLGKAKDEIPGEPFMASFPHLLDIGIMGHCLHGKEKLCWQAGVQCYQDGVHRFEANMSLEAFTHIVRQCRNKVFQVALGGRGDPDQHEGFEDILRVCREHRIIPNFTTSGLGLTRPLAEVSRKYCGAVAVSWYRQGHTFKAVNMLLSSGVKTNIHYVLGANSLEEAIFLVDKGKLPPGINAVLFLLHKPVGLGRKENIVCPEDPKVREFFQLIGRRRWPFKVGFDSCTVSALINFAPNVDLTYMDTCEAGRFSAYITPDLKMLPCSFDQEMRWSHDISTHSLQDAWESPPFEGFRALMRKACPGCRERLNCLGGCPLCEEIVLCIRDERQGRQKVAPANIR
jgi:radical SAM protein with 4Fe4S-binding SPASM domain